MTWKVIVMTISIETICDLVIVKAVRVSAAADVLGVHAQCGELSTVVARTKLTTQATVDVPWRIIL